MTLPATRRRRSGRRANAAKRRSVPTSCALCARSSRSEDALACPHPDGDGDGDTEGAAGVGADLLASTQGGRPARLASRIAVVAGAAVAGMVVGAALVMLAASTLGIRPELAILFMLLAELSCGALSGYAADVKVQRWLRAHSETRRPELPRALLLSDGQDTGQSR